MLVTVPYCGLAFRVVGLSTPSVPTLCLKDQQMGDDTIYPELLLTVGEVRWGKLPGCWQLKDKENSFNNQQSFIETQWCNNNIYSVFIERNSRFC